MSDFDLFKQALQQYNNKQAKTKKTPIDQVRAKIKSKIRERSKEEKKCHHTNIVVEKGINICTECGEEMLEDLHSQEWKNFNSTKSYSDLGRIQTRKTEEHSIYKDVSGMGFSDNIVDKANQIYFQVTNEKIYRGDNRKSIIFACIFYTYKLTGKPQAYEKLIRVFGITRKTALKGLKTVFINAPKELKMSLSQITPINLMKENMDAFGATEKQKEEVYELYKKIKNKSSKLNRSRPQSIAAALTFYWICKKKKNISLKEFTAKTDLSETTISKLASEIANILGTPDVV